MSRTNPAGRGAVLAASLFAGCLAIAAVPTATGQWSTGEFAAAAALAIATWTIFLLAISARPPIQPQTAPEAQNAGLSWLAILMLGAFVLLAAVHWLTHVDYMTFFDEPIYVLQSRLMREPGFVRPMDETLSPFFTLRQTIFDNGRFYTQYPPGLPAILAAFDAAGLRWWTGIVLSTAGVFFTYLLGRELVSPFAGRAAAAMLAANQLFVAYGASYMPHGPTIALATAAAWLLVRSARLRGWRASLSWIVAGSLLGSTVAIRPLTGAAITASIVLWQFVRRTHNRGRLIVLAGFLVLGLALPAAGTAYYNNVTNGSPFAFGYGAAHGSLHNLGFGSRGFAEPGVLAETRTETIDFTARRAILNLFFVAANLAQTILPALLFVPIIVIGYRSGYTFRWATIAVFLVLPALHFFYFYPHVRFYLELFPFVFVGLAGMLAHVRQEDPSLVRGMLAVLLAAELVVTGFNVRRRTTDADAHVRHAAIQALHEAQQPGRKLLVFVEGHYALLNWASWFNIDDFPGDVIVARDLGEKNHHVTAMFPDHVPMQMTMAGQKIQLKRVE